MDKAKPKGPFAERLRELRDAAGLSQAELAEKAGMHRFGITKLEYGHREPAWSTVQALAEALGVTCAEFEKPPGSPINFGRPSKAPPPKPKPKRGKR